MVPFILAYGYASFSPIDKGKYSFKLSVPISIPLYVIFAFSISSSGFILIPSIKYPSLLTYSLSLPIIPFTAIWLSNEYVITTSILVVLYLQLYDIYGFNPYSFWPSVFIFTSSSAFASVFTSAILEYGEYIYNPSYIVYTNAGI